jgi:hypothetical protein
LVRQIIQNAIARGIRPIAEWPFENYLPELYGDAGFAVKISDFLIARMIATRDLRIVIAATVMFLVLVQIRRRFPYIGISGS